MSFGFNWVLGQCGVQDTLIDIPDDETPIEFKLIVSGIQNDNLSSPSQCVKQVTLHYDHTSRTELTIDLVSPSGQKVGLVGPFVDKFYLTQNAIEWDISFVPDSDLASPDNGKSERFDNDDDWYYKGTPYNGVYYPNSGSLEDFNLGTVNGVWTFVIHDHDRIYNGHFYGASIEFCDGSTIDCDVCKSDAGYFKETEFSFCEDDPNRFVDLEVLFDNNSSEEYGYGYEYLIYKGNTFIDITNDPELDTLSYGTYKICGISYHRDDYPALYEMIEVEGVEKLVDSIEVLGSPYCVDVTDTCISLNILQVSDKINIDTSICYGDTLYFEGQKLYSEGKYYISLPSYNCEKSYVVSLKVWDINAGIYANSDTITCPAGFVMLTGEGYIDDEEGMDYKWSDNVSTNYISTDIYVSTPGIYDFIVIGGNCSDTASIEIFMDTEVPQLEFDIDTIDCFTDVAKLKVSSPNSDLVSVSWWDEEANQYEGTEIETSVAGYYEIFATSSNECTVSQTIQVLADTTKPKAEITSTVITCNSDTSFIDFSSADSLISIEWLGLGKSKGDTFVLDSGWYYVEYQGANGCISLDSIHVEAELDVLQVSIYYDTLNCAVNQSLVGANSSEKNLDYLWINPNGDSIRDESFYTSLSGTYRYEIAGQNGCRSIGNFDIVLDTIPFKLSFDTDVLYLNCDSPTQIKYTIIDSLVSFYWEGPADFTSDDTFPIVEYEGVYNLYISGKNKCVTRYQFTVLNDDSFEDIQINGDAVSCIDSEANLSVEYDDSNNYSFKWEDSIGVVYYGNDISVTYGGYFYLTVTDNDINCERVFYTYVPFNDTQLEITIDTSNILDCEHDSVVIRLQTNIELESIHWTGPGIDSDNDSIEVTLPGVYYVDAVGISKCTDYDSIVVPPEEFLVLSPDTLYLNCGNDSIVELRVKGISEDNSFKWKGPNLETSEPSPVVSEPGKYNVIVTKGHCIDTTDIVVEADFDLPEVSISYDTIILCDPNYSIIKTDLDTSKLQSYSWTGPNGYQSQKLIDTVYTEGRYQFYAIGKNGCDVDFAMDILRSPDYPTVMTKGDSIDCINGVHELVIEADIQGDYNFVQWTGPGGFSSGSLSSTVVEDGWYYLYVKNEKKCVVEDSVYVLIDTLPPDADILPIDTITCIKDSVNISVSPADFDGKVYWESPFSNSYYEGNQVTVDEGGEYRVTLVGSNGCSSTDTISVPVNKLKPYLWLEAGNLDGNNAKITIDLNTSASSFSTLWSGPDGFSSTDEDITVNVAGKYHVLLIDEENGCQNEDSISIIWDTIPPNIFAEDYYLPCDTSIRIEMIVFSEASNCEFYWSGPQNFYATGSTAYTNIPGEYTIIARGPNGMYNQTSINVFDIPIYPEFDAFGYDFNCYSDSSSVKAIGVYDDEFFEWLGPDGFHSLEREATIYKPGTYTLVVTGKNKCIDSFDLEINIDSLKPEVDIEQIEPFICERIEGRLKANVSSDTLGAFSFSWSTSGGKILQGSNSSYPLVEGKGSYYVSVLNHQNGCVGIDSIQVESNIYDLDSINFSVIAPSCYGYTDGVINIDSVFGGSAPYTYSLDNYWFSNNKSFNSKEAGSYKIYVKDVNGCKVDTTVVVNNGSQVQVALNVDKDSILSGDLINLEAIVYSKNPIENYYWTPEQYFDSPNNRIQSIALTKSSDITVEVVDSNGCYDKKSIWIRVKEYPNVFIPNIFSPNHDGLNDYFYMKSESGIKSIKKLTIYDRWGGKVFENENLRQNVSIDGWDGKCSGKEVMAGVYVYSFILELNNGDLLDLTGDITLVK